MRMLPTLLACCGVVIGLNTALRAEERPKLPEPMDRVAIDAGFLDEHFTVTEIRLYGVKEFQSLGAPNRPISEQVLLWTLEAKSDLEGKAAAELFERPSFPRVVFYALAGDERTAVEHRTGGYFLASDRRWIRGDGPPLKKGDRLTVYTPIGKTGADDLSQAKAALVVFERAKP